MPHGKPLNTKYIKYKNIYFTASEHKHALKTQAWWDKTVS